MLDVMKANISKKREKKEENLEINDITLILFKSFKKFKLGSMQTINFREHTNRKPNRLCSIQSQ